MSDAPFMPFWVGDYIADTPHLTTAENGAYLLILFTMWHAGGWLPNDDARLARIARMTPSRWRKIKPTILAFMTVDGNLITQKRLLRELEIARGKTAKARAAGRDGGRAKASRRRQSSLGYASQMPEAKSQGRSDNQDQDLTEEETELEKFEVFWRAYPRDEAMSKARAIAEWKLLSAAERDEAVEAAPIFRAHCAKQPDRLVIHAKTFLKERHAKDVLAISGAQSAPAAAAGTHIKPGTPQWDAWDSHYRRHKGRRPPTDSRGGWMFPSEYPPQETEAAA